MIKNISLHLLLVAVLLLPLSAGEKLIYAQVLFSDNFEQLSPWDGCPDDTMATNMPEWNDYFGTWTCNKLSIVDDGGNRVLRFDWPTSMTSLGPGVPASATAGRGDVYVGFKWRHDAAWDWGSDATHKWVYFPETGGNRTMLSIVYGGIAWFDGTDYNMQATNDPHTASSSWLNDTSWHDIVIYSSPATSMIRVWYDGTELTWSEDNTGGANYGGSAFDSGPANSFVFGYQSRPDWGSGNTSYFDNIIVATTKEDVDAYLGGATPTGRPAKPVGLIVQ